MSFLGIKNPFSTGAGAVKREAANATAARQGRASNLTTLIDNTFSDPSREAGITDFMGALRTQLGENTDRNYTRSARSTKFATARQGLTGGSADANRQQRGLEDLFAERVGNEAQVQDAGNQLRQQDLAAKQALINSAYGTAGVGQSALRSLLGQQVGNTNYLSTLLPSLLSRGGA